MRNSNKGGSGTPKILLMIFGITILAILLGPRMVFIINIVLLASIIVGAFYLAKYLMEKKHQKAFERSSEGYVYKHIQQCEGKIVKNEEEILEIEQNIADLRSKINPKLEMSEATKKESDRILDAFYEEVKLRQTKIQFYKTCLKKLQTIRYNHQMTRELIQKQKALNQLQEDHYEDVASMETLKSDVEHDQFYLSSIENLTLRMTSSKSVSAVENLQLELVEITKELRRL